MQKGHEEKINSTGITRRNHFYIKISILFLNVLGDPVFITLNISILFKIFLQNILWNHYWITGPEILKSEQYPKDFTTRALSTDLPKNPLCRSNPSSNDVDSLSSRYGTILKCGPRLTTPRLELTRGLQFQQEVPSLICQNSRHTCSSFPKHLCHS